jgi:glycerophosphoryl diester phosphodiesterase
VTGDNAEDRASTRSPSFEIVGHGGAGAFYPGNTRDALLTGLRLGVDRIEFDLMTAGDGQLVLVHDLQHADEEGVIHKTATSPVELLKRILPGFITFDEAVELTKGKVPLLLDVKVPGFEPVLIASIKRHELEDEIHISCTNPRTIKLLRKAFPAIPIGLSTGHRPTGGALVFGRPIAGTILRAIGPFPLLTAMRWCGANEIMLHRHLVSRRVVRAFHRRGYKVYAWTVDKPNEIKWIAACQVDGIISNRPDLVQDLLRPERVAGRY